MTLSGKTWTAGEALGSSHRTDHNRLKTAFDNRGYDVTEYGAVGDGTTDDTAAIQAAIDAADAAGTAHSSNHASNAPGKTITVYCPPGIYLTTGLDLDGKNVNLAGAGPAATRFRADPDITGYVISMDGWKGQLAHQRGSSPFGGFSIEGTHTADATLATGGLYIAGCQVCMADVSIFGTGGPAMKVGASVNLSNFDRIMLQRPVGADTNDVPYLHITDTHNGNVWDRLMLRSVTSDLDGSTVVKVDPPSVSTNHISKFRDPWLEFQHTPDGGAIFDISGDNYVITDIQSFDVSGENGASSNCVVRFRGDACELRGWIPGRGTAATNIRYGVIVDGNGSRIVGLRGYRDYNVKLNSGVNYTHVEVGGVLSTPTGNPVVEDNSGTSTNTIVVWTDNGADRIMTFPEMKFTGDLGFFGATPVSQPSVTGATDTAKLTSLLAALDSLGLISDNTT